MIRSLRSRLLLGMIAGMTVLLVLFSLIIYFVIRDALEEQFNQSLATSVRLLASGVELEIPESDTEPGGQQDENNEVDIEFDVQMMPEFQREKHPSYFQIWRQDGTAVARSPSLGQSDLSRIEGIPGQPVFRHTDARHSQYPHPARIPSPWPHTPGRYRYAAPADPGSSY